MFSWTVAHVVWSFDPFCLLLNEEMFLIYKNKMLESNNAWLMLSKKLSLELQKLIYQCNYLVMNFVDQNMTQYTRSGFK